MGALTRRVVDGIGFTGVFSGETVFAFTERTGGVSSEPYASLNLGAHVGDDPAAVAENRRRALAALGCDGLADRLLTANQVHGDHVAVVNGGRDLDCVRDELAAGADAVVCTVPDVPVMLLFADCTPVVLTAPGGFAVVHSGWRGTLARISGKAACVLARETGSSPEEVSAYVGPHILGSEYEVSDELLHTFCLQFANMNITRPARLDMSAAVRTSLEESGVPPCAIHDEQLSTMSRNDRFFSDRAENGVCGRHGAIAYMPSARS